MTLTAILLVTLSAFAHAFWNYLGKRQNPTAAFFWVASCAAALVLLPVILLYRNNLALPLNVWGMIAVTGAFQSCYYVGLAGAYRHGILSLAYPLARALPVVGVALISLALGRGTQMSLMALAGFLVVTLGCLVLPLQHMGEWRWRDYFNPCCLFALMAACCTIGYTLVDDQILRSLRALSAAQNWQSSLTIPQITLLFAALEAASILVFLTLFVWIVPSERRALAAIFRHNWLVAGLTGLIITAAYGLVLLAMSYAHNVSYIAAFRQLSIPIGAGLGILMRGEPAYPPKLIGISLIVVGLILTVVG